ncbi:integrase, catalytic region, zinc finger, CCHC-type containing protein, partial [Tanacetum coccineum]
MEKLEDENVSLDFTVQSLIKERDNVKLEYQKLFNSIKKTRSQTQTEMDELIAHVSEKTYAYGAIRAENQNLLFTISELKTRLANVEKEENHVVSKPVTLQTSPAKQRGVNSNKNVIAPGMYKVVTTHESQTNEAKHDLSSTGMTAASSVRRPMNRDSHVKNSVLANSKKPAKKVAVYVRKNKQTDNTSENVISNKENVIDVDVANASKEKTLLCVSCMQNVLIPCHDNCFANYKLNVHSNVRRTLSTKSRTPKSYDTTYVVSKPKIDVGSTSKDNDKVRILQKSQENGQNRTNTNTGSDKVYKSQEFLAKSIKEGTISDGTVLPDVVTGGTEGEGQHQGPRRARVLNRPSAEEKESIKLTFVNQDPTSGSELTKDDRGSQKHPDDHVPGCSFNSKFVNNMLPELSRFITEVKLNRGLKESNCDQLFFGQPNNDPLALVSDASVQQYPTQSSKSKEPSPADNFQMDSGSSSTENLIERRPFKKQARGNGVAGNVGGHNRGGMINPGQTKPIKCYNCNGLGHIARECPRPKRLQDSDYFKDKMLLMQAQESGAVLDENSPFFFTMFMANLTSEDPIYDEVGPSYDSKIQLMYQDHDVFHLKESVETVREIVEEARVVKPLDSSLNYACRYTKLSQELLQCVIGTCPKGFNERDDKAPSTPVTRKKQVTFSDKPGTSSSNAQKHKVHQRVQLTNIPVLPSTRVNDFTEASGSKPRSNTKKNRILPAKKENKKEVEVSPRTNKSVWTKVNPVDSNISSKRVVINSNSESINSASNGMCVVNVLNSVNATPTVRIVL